MSESPIQRLNYGIIFQPKGIINFSPDSWYHTFTINLPSPIAIRDVAVCHETHKEHSCHRVNNIVQHLNILHHQTAIIMNETVSTIHKMFPQTTLLQDQQTTQSRQKRSLLPFFGSIFKGLFGTATTDDLNVIKRHIQAINNQNVQLARAIRQHGNHLSSFMSKVDDRLNNAMQGLQENHREITTLAVQVNNAFDSLEQSYSSMFKISLEQISITSKIQSQLEELKLGIFQLAQGRLSPLLIAPHIIRHTISHIQHILNLKYNNFHLPNMNTSDFYKITDFIVARHHSRLFITIKLPLSTFRSHPFIYSVIAVPVPVNSTTSHATQLLDTPEHFIITANKQQYTTISSEQLNTCGRTNKDTTVCTSNLIWTAITSPSCISALFTNDKNQVHSLCDFRFLRDHLSSSILSLSASSVLLYKIPLLALQCPSGHKMVPGCSFCVLTIPCRCSLSTQSIIIPASLANCGAVTDNITKVHPVNLALLQEFFSAESLTSLSGDTLYPEAISVEIPKLHLYNHSFSHLLANDKAIHLSLKKIAAATKQDSVAFKSLAEPILDGLIDVTPGYFSYTAIISYASATIATTAILGFIWIYSKFRALTTSLILANRISATRAYVLPSFSYLTPQSPQDTTTLLTTTSTLEDYGISTAWIPFITIILIMAISMWWRKRNHTTILLELRNHKSCLTIPIFTLNTCPSHWKITPPKMIANVEVIGSLRPIIHIDWLNWSIIHFASQRPIQIPCDIHINPWTAYLTRAMCQSEYFAYIIIKHNDYGTILNYESAGQN